MRLRHHIGHDRYGNAREQGADEFEESDVLVLAAISEQRDARDVGKKGDSEPQPSSAYVPDGCGREHFALGKTAEQFTGVMQRQDYRQDHDFHR